MREHHETMSMLEQLARQGDVDTWNLVVEHHGSVMQAAVMAVFRDPQDAADVLQEVFLHLRNQAHRFRLRADGGAVEDQERRWIQRLTLNVAFNWRLANLRRRRREQANMKAVAVHADDPADSEASEASEERYHTLHACLAELAEPQRQVLVMHFLQGLDHTALAQQLKCTSGACRVRLHRALESLRTVMGRRGQVLGIAALSGLLVTFGTSLQAATPPVVAAGTLMTWKALFVSTAVPQLPAASVVGGGFTIAKATLVVGSILLIGATVTTATLVAVHPLNVPPTAAMGATLATPSVLPQTVTPVTMAAIHREISTPYKYGIVLTGLNGGDADCPSVFRHGDHWYMAYTEHEQGGRATHLATSDDLLHWRHLGSILPRVRNGWDGQQSLGFVALQDHVWDGSSTLQNFQGKYWLSYSGGDQGGGQLPFAVGIAWSEHPDRPEAWERLSKPVLTADQSDARAFEQKTLYKSNLIWDKDRTLGHPFVMFYNGVPESGQAGIGLAVSDDLRTWTRYGDEAVLSASGYCADPQVVRIGELWVMFYFTSIDKVGVCDSFACSYDLKHWTRWSGEPLVRPSQPYDATYAHKPWVIKHDGVVYHYYCGVGNQGRVIALATSKDLRVPNPSTP